jgi:8-oxo-dGTP pyrophosphatase MutT (NUDIX family)
MLPLRSIPTVSAVFNPALAFPDRMQITVDLLRAALASDKRPLADLAHGPIDVSRARAAGVVIPLALLPEPRVYLMVRGADLTDHAGEVCFPGGKPEAHDLDLRATAARELEEEVAVQRAELTWVGELSPTPVITGRFLIHPFVAVLNEGVVPRPASSEVARIVSLPLIPLLTGELPTFAVKRLWDGVAVTAPHFPVEGNVLYGATAYIFYELLAKIALELDHALPPFVLQDEPPWGTRYAK